MDSFFINSEMQMPKEGDKVVNVTPNSKGTGYLIRFADCVTGQDKLISVAVGSQPSETEDKSPGPTLQEMMEAMLSKVFPMHGYKIAPMQYVDIPEVARMDALSQDRQRMLDLAIRCGAITNDELRLECGLERTGTDWGMRLATYGNTEPLR